MKVKKALSGVLIAGIIFTSGGVVFADQQVPAEIALEVGEDKLTEEVAREMTEKYLREFFNIEVDEENQIRLEYRENWGGAGEHIWNLHLYRNQRDGGLNIDMTINAKTGKLISVNKYEYNHSEDNQVSKYTREEAQQLAEMFLREKHGELLPQLDINPSDDHIYYQQNTGLRPTEHRFFYRRQQEGVYVLNDGITVGISSGTGEINSYSYNWSDEELPKKGSVVSKEEAGEVLKNNLKLNLNYIPVRDERNPYEQSLQEIKLAYSPSYEAGSMVDAHTGKSIDLSQMGREEVKKVNMTEEQRNRLNRSVAVKPSREKEMTREEANQLAKETLNKIYDEETKLISTNYASSGGMGSGERKLWEVGFGLGDQNMAQGSMAFDALTGEVAHIHYYNFRMQEGLGSQDEGFEPEVTWEEAYHRAVDILIDIHPDKLRNSETEQTYYESHHYYNGQRMQDERYHFTFSRKENGIPVNMNHISVEFNGATGNLENMYVNWQEATFPKVTDVMDEEEMKVRFLEQTEVQLGYNFIPVVADGEESTQKVKLVYINRPKNGSVYFNYIDGKTGQFLNWQGQAMDQVKEGVSHSLEMIKGHWAERELRIMVETGALDLKEKDLEDKMTRNEVLKMMVNARGQGHYWGEEEPLKFTDISKSDFNYRDIQSAVFHGLIKNEAKPLNGDEFITREELAAMLVNMAKLEKVAQIEGIYTLPFIDVMEISQDRFGHVAIAYGLEILKGGGTTYGPKDEVDIAQVSVGIYRTMEVMGNSVR
ncbi:hypothetical protein Amet_4606 [Alkaliphilus metalliredigens QYMF]|uniref:SLH domain-containing protein n=1 Tax=Alkaliphilus metalliredigens (strain QYMF) TaxID=293826 RepID=A6TWV9_ALKMQ|nr:YcdB/YcdC domain-containing protein [Alkaliphilus metalliredigens]ABR50677.1 hypothetical protein Amet_4606 [Alkaliphilus metalliredigens QYMF]